MHMRQLPSGKISKLNMKRKKKNSPRETYKWESCMDIIFIREWSLAPGQFQFTWCVNFLILIISLFSVAHG